MSLTHRMVAGSVALAVALVCVFTAQPSQAMTFSFPGSGSSNNNSFSFVAPQVPQVLRQEFTGTASYSFGNLIPPSIRSFSFGGSSYGYQPPHNNGSYSYNNQPSQNTYSYGNGGYSYGWGSSNSGSSYSYGSGSSNGGSSYSYGTGSTSGGSSSGSGYSYGTGSTSGSSSSGSSSSGSSYSYGTGSSSGGSSTAGGSSSTSGSSGSTSGSSSSGSSSSGSSSTGGSSSSSSSSSSEDNADGPADSLAVAKTTSGASVVNLMLNGQLTQGNNLPSFMNGQNPFSYYLVKGKPNGNTLKTMYNFNSSSNAFSLKTCNPYNKPFNWSLQINPNSIPQNLVLMSTPQVTGGQTCSAGATGSCKKPTQICYYADSYTAPSTLALSSSAPSWMVNMASVWGGPINAYAAVSATGTPLGTLPNLPVGGVETITANTNLSTVPPSPVTISTTSPSTAKWGIKFAPGPLAVTYNGAVGSATPGGPSYTFCAWVIDTGNNNFYWCPPHQLTCSYTFPAIGTNSLSVSGSDGYNWTFAQPFFVLTGNYCGFAAAGVKSMVLPPKSAF